MSEKNAPKPESGPSPIGEISQEPSAFESFLDANQKKLILIGILAILGLIAYVIFDGLSKLSAQNAAGEVAAARSIPELDAASKNHEGSNAGGSALLLKSQLLWRDQQRQEAVEAVETFISSYPDHPAIGNAHASLGSYKQQMGQIEEAKTAFLKASETEGSSASSLALLSLGDLARSAGNDDEAKALYDRIISEYEDRHFQVKSMARDRLKLIGVAAPTEKAPTATEPNTPQNTPSVTSKPLTIPGLPPLTTPGQKTDDAKETDPKEDGELGELPDLELPEKSQGSEPAKQPAPPTPAPAE